MSSGNALRTACRQCAFRAVAASVRRKCPVQALTIVHFCSPHATVLLRCFATTNSTRTVAVATAAAQSYQQSRQDRSFYFEWAAAASVLTAGTLALSQVHQSDESPSSVSTSSSLSSSLLEGSPAAPAPAPAPLTTATLTTTSCEPSSSRRAKNQPRNVMLHRMRSVRARGLNEKYNVDWKTVLGEGAYGSVHPARLAATGEKVALKKISRRYTNSSAFKRETDALLRIYDNGGHPNIGGMRDMYEDHNSYYLILDLVTGGEMFEHLINYGAYSEADAARLMHEVASALAFLHGVGVCHADLKPENLMLSTKNRLDGTIKIIDFGCAVVNDGDFADQDEEKRSKRFFLGRSAYQSAASTGTTAYWPPERFESGTAATPSMDMWAVGVILYIMLTGVHPFDRHGTLTDEEIEAKIRKDPRPPLDKELVGHLSQSAIELILKLMEADPSKRLSAYEMLQHPWVRGETALKEKIQDSDKKLSRFKDLRSQLEAGMFAVLVSQGYSDARLSEAKVKKKISEQDSSSHIMQKAFAAFDAEGKGFVTSDDLGRVASERTGKKISSSDTREFLATQSGDTSTAAALSLSQFNKLFSGLNHKHFPRGHFIFHANDPGDSMYFLSSGKVEIQTRKGQLVAILRSGDFFGEGSLLEEKNHRRFTSAKCATPVDVIEIKKADFDRYMGASESAKNDIRVKWRARSLQYAKNLLRLQQNVRIRTYKKGDVVYNEGDTGTSMFRVDDEDGGVLEVSHNGTVVHKYYGGDSFGESSLLFKKPRSSTVRCASETCRVHEMKAEDFLAVIETNPGMAASLRDMCRKRLFKKAVKQYSLSKKRGLSDEDLIAAFHDADIDKSGYLNLDEVRRLIHRMDPNYPMEEIAALLKYVDVDEDGLLGFEEYIRLFRQFEKEKEEVHANDL